MSFYMTLPCTASHGAHPHNSVSKYTTDLPRPLDFTGSWEVGLSKVVFPHLSVKLPTDPVIAITNVSEHGQSKKSYKTPGGRTSLEELAWGLNFMAPECEESGSPCYNINFKNGWTKLTIQPGSKISFEDAPLCKILGVVYGRQYNAGEHEFRSGGMTSIIHVYCDIIEHVPLGDALVPCLRTIPVFNQGEEYVVQRYENPHYVPLLKNKIASIEVEFADDAGDTARFGGEFSFIMLHFRPRKRY